MSFHLKSPAAICARRIKILLLCVLAALQPLQPAAAQPGKEIGVYSGSFDPPTRAHLAIMETALRQYDLRRLYVLINFSSGKMLKASLREREEMLRLMTGKIAGRLVFLPVISPDEKFVIEKRILQAEGAGRLFAFIGEDSYAKLPVPRPAGPEPVWVVIPRGGGNGVREADGVRILRVPGIGSISSSAARKSVSEGDADSAPVTPGIKNYIRENGLYVPVGAGGVQRLQRGLFRDTCRFFIRGITAFYGTDRSSLVCPEFDPLRSVQGWADSLAASVIEQARMDGKSAAEFKETALNRLLLRPENIASPRMYFLSPFSIPADAPAPAIKSVVKVSLREREFRQDDYIMRLDDYVANSMPGALQDFVKEHNAPVYIHDANSEGSLAFHRAEGFSEMFRFYSYKPGRKMYVARKPGTEEYRLVLPGMKAGTGRQRHIKLLLAYFMSEAFEVAHEKSAPTYQLEPAAEPVLFGPGDKIVMGYKPVIMHQLAKLNAHFSCSSMAKTGFDIDICTASPAGPKYAFAENPYGDAMTEMADLFYARGARNFTFLGSAGGLGESVKCGDIMVPSQVETSSAVFTDVANSAAGLLSGIDTSIVHGGAREASVDAVLDETKLKIAEMRGNGADCVEMEGKHLVSYCALKKDCALSMLLFITDLPGTPDKTMRSNLACEQAVKENVRAVGGNLLPARPGPVPEPG